MQLLGCNNTGKGEGPSLIYAFILLSVVETIKSFFPRLSQPTYPLQDGYWLFFKGMRTRSLEYCSFSSQLQEKEAGDLTERPDLMIK